MKRITLLIFLVTALCVNIASAEVGDLAPAEPKPIMRASTPLYAYGNSFISAPEDCGTVHPKATIATLGQIKVAIDADKSDAPKSNVIRIDLTGRGKFEDALIAPLKITRSAQVYVVAEIPQTLVNVEHDAVVV